MGAESGSASKPAVLVVDDEEVVRLLFQNLLEGEGHPTLLAETGQQGVQLLNQHRPPLALVDKNLPDVSGLDLIADQKKHHPNTEFIMITGYASLDSAVQAMEIGAFSYLTKPFADMETVMDRIRAALEVNTLRVETTLLRDRLADVGPPSQPAPAHRAPADDALRTQLAHTIRLLESFLDKRHQPPTEAIWARLVDMLEEEARRLRQLVGAPADRGES